MDGVAKALHEDPRLLDVSDEGFLVNTGKQLILVDAGAGDLVGWGEHSGAWRAASAAQATRRKEIDIVCGHAPPFRPRRRPLTTQDGKARFSKCRSLRREG